MMKVSIKTLNDGYPALRNLASQTLSKEQFKLTYKLGRILKSAKAEIEETGEHLKKMMATLKVTSDEKDFQPDPKNVREYNDAANKFMKETDVEIWGDAFQVGEILGVITISSEDYANLDGWLIQGDLTDEQLKAMNAGA